MSDDFVSRLPVFKAVKSQDFPGFLIVTCGRKDCGTRPFLVAQREWLRPRRTVSVKDNKTVIITGRVCPYCSKAGRVPNRSEIG